MAQLVSGELSFEGRVTRKATDAVNQSLNYVYGMLYGEVWRAIVKVGLDPYFGIVHGSERNQGGLVFDLIEEFRAPFADRIVFGMLGRGFIPEIGEHGFLKTRSKRRLAYGFAKRWSKKISWRSRELSPAEILEKQAAAFAMLMKREDRCHPFRMRW
ncbi:CRISPR-associated endonuclease Cas1 [bacterium]|nr:CRISPR-associated endonuclease Cas1 [bacterium]